MIKVIDNFLGEPESYRRDALALEFNSIHFENCSFHGIAMGGRSGELATRLCAEFPGIQPSLTFFRKSPLAQTEPHFIHTDIDMGEWSAILYLNQNPPDGDGTCFWTHRGTGAIGSFVPHERSSEGHYTEGWILREHVQAKFNRLLMFPSSYFHSRAIHENWGAGDAARLTQVTFGKEALCR